MYSFRETIPLRCKCGRVRGVAMDVSRSTGFRFVCYCKDCQAFARFLERADVLDTAGGTDIFQMPPARVRLTEGTEAIRCLRLSDKILRWYTDCCRTPIANTAADSRFPLAGTIHCFHGPRSRRPLSRFGARAAALPHLRAFRYRVSATQRTTSAVVWSLHPPHFKVLRLVVVRARSADAILPRAHEGSTFRAGRPHVGRARCALFAVTMPPNPSFHPTCYGRLRRPSPAGELKRWADKVHQSPAERFERTR